MVVTSTREQSREQTREQSREQTRADTRDRIVSAARSLLVRDGSVSLRAVARELGMTAPALYRYAANHEDLVLMVALDIDSEVADRLRRVAARLPADDPAARMVAGSVEFRRWALENRHEFSLVFTNVDVSCLEQMQGTASTGMFFSDLLVEVWAKYQFPIPALADLPEGLQRILEDPLVPADLSTMSDELRPLVWVLERAWAGLYGTVTLEVYGHIDPRIVEQAHLFRAMIEDQAPRLGLTGELPRLLALLDEMLVG